jgi:hypothetical protein
VAGGLENLPEESVDGLLAYATTRPRIVALAAREARRVPGFSQLRKLSGSPR